ncbi:MAG: HD domain-containing protein [Candidatus Thorarchaeota archaeon]
MLHDNDWPIPEGRNGLSVWRTNRLIAIIHQKIQSLIESERELPMVWSQMHMFSSMQLGKLLALSRGLDPEFASILCVLHDIYTIFTGKTEEHGIRAESYIREIIFEYNELKGNKLKLFTAEEVSQLIEAIKIHSEKNTITDDPYAELLKDVDSLDSYLHGMTPGRRSGRLPRVNSVLEELGIEHKVTK